MKLQKPTSEKSRKFRKRKSPTDCLTVDCFMMLRSNAVSEELESVSSCKKDVPNITVQDMGIGWNIVNQAVHEAAT